ncbi:ORF6 [Caenorhabditis elegans]|uniref:ORF6 n=1 Tax=Caenorhabditis elegans TaxID=6239 RepID=Q75KS1_CAEEL|nr:ORF6 [Caenorhabditis elegans]CCD66825.2 ORF6 [Caenorhabditis elegans]|eukprot:NP_001021750.2 Uncharacterized protein CELE_Y37F4.7 [Caenorhabditis elegans]
MDSTEIDLIIWFLGFFVVSTIITIFCICIRILRSQAHISQTDCCHCVCAWPRGFVKRPPKRIVLLEPTTRIQQSGFTIYCVDRPMPVTNLPYHYDKVKVETCLNTLFGTKSIFLPETTVAVSIPARGFSSMSEFHMFSKTDSQRESLSGYSYEMLSSSVQASSTDTSNCLFGCTSHSLAGVTVYLGIGGSSERINSDAILIRMIHNVHRYGGRWIPFSRSYIWMRSFLRNWWKPTVPNVAAYNRSFSLHRNSNSDSCGFRLRQPFVHQPCPLGENQRMFAPRPYPHQWNLRQYRRWIPADVHVNPISQLSPESAPRMRSPTETHIEMPRDTPSPVKDPEVTCSYNKDPPPDYATLDLVDLCQPPPYWKIF